MDLTKKLVILTGKRGNGTALIEHNGMGTFVTLNTFSLPDLSSGEYALGVKTASSVFRREVGSLGRIKSRFALPEGDYLAVHIVLFRTNDEEVVLYGVSEARKLWEGNIMDGLRRERVEKKAVDFKKASAPQAEEFKYSQRKIEDYFLDIRPTEYADDKVAEENYFEFSRPAPQTFERADTPVSPSEMQRRYLSERFGSRSVSLPEGNREKHSVKPEVATEPVKKPEEREIAAAAAPKLSDTAPILKIKKASDYTAQEAVSAVKTDADFFTSVKPKLDELFKRGEAYEPLSKAIQGTRWIKVNYDDSGRYYVVGLIGSSPDFIAYGVPGKYGAPPEAFENADFIPLNAEKPEEGGFWVLFQSAATGEEIIK